MSWSAFSAGMIVAMVMLVLGLFVMQGVKDQIAQSCDQRGYFISHGTIYECKRRGLP